MLGRLFFHIARPWVVAGCVALSARAVVVYDSLTTPVGNMPIAPDDTLSDLVTLTGSARRLTSITIALYGPGPKSPAQFNFSLRLADGVNGGPGTAVFGTDWQACPAGGLLVLDENALAPLREPVPDTFYWCVEVNGYPWDPVGLVNYGLPAVGSTDAGMWSWMYGHINYGDSPETTPGARFKAIPEPAAGLLLLLGWAVFGSTPRRRAGHGEPQDAG
jgi:hypothetical protein